MTTNFILMTYLRHITRSSLVFNTLGLTRMQRMYTKQPYQIVLVTQSLSFLAPPYQPFPSLVLSRFKVVLVLNSIYLSHCSKLTDNVPIVSKTCLSMLRSLKTRKMTILLHTKIWEWETSISTRATSK